MQILTGADARGPQLIMISSTTRPATTTGEDFVNWKRPTGGDSTLGIVDFSIFPHLGHELMPRNTVDEAERWARARACRDCQRGVGRADLALGRGAELA